MDETITLAKVLTVYGPLGVMLGIVCLFCWNLFKRQDIKDAEHKQERREERAEFLASLDKRDAAQDRLADSLDKLADGLNSVCRGPK